MAQLNPSIILQGQSPNILAAMDAGQQAGARQNAIQQQNALSQAYKTDGAGIIAGEQGALNRLAAIDAPLAMDFRTSQQTMQVNAQNAQLRAAELASTLDARQREQLGAAFERGAGMLAAAQTPEQRQMLLSQPGFQEAAQALGIPPEALTAENADTIIGAAIGAAEAMKMRGDGQKPTAGIQEYEFAKSQGYTGTFEQWKASGRASTNVTVNTGEGEQNRYLYGSDAGLPTGWQLDRLTGQASPIPGGPAAVEAEAASAQAASAANQKGVTSDLVMDEIRIARELIEGQSLTSPATGIAGGIASNVDSTRAGALKNRLETIKANIGFDKLQAMREASPTGGALGAVSEFENRLLQAVYGSLVQSQREEDILYNLNRLEEVYNRIVNEGISEDEARTLYQNEVTGNFGGGQAQGGGNRTSSGVSWSIEE